MSCLRRAGQCPARKEQANVLLAKRRPISCLQRAGQCPAREEQANVLLFESRLVACLASSEQAGQPVLCKQDVLQLEFSNFSIFQSI
jgi:hypothetical protein